MKSGLSNKIVLFFVLAFLVSVANAQTKVHLGMHCFNLKANDYPDESCASISRSGADWTGKISGWGNVSLGFDPHGFATQSAIEQIVLSPILTRDPSSNYTLSKASILIDKMDSLEINIGRMSGITSTTEAPKHGLSGMYGYEGWDQLGLKTDWTGIEGRLRVSAQLGNGEGEWPSNREGGEYYGLSTSYQFPGFAKVFLASSINASSRGSAEWDSIYSGRSPHDAKTSRTSLGFSIADSLDILRGFYFDANLKRIVMTLDGFDSKASLDEGPYDPQQWWTPDLGSWEQDSIQIAMTYRILKVYGISVGHERRRVEYSNELVGQCSQITQNKCQDQSSLVGQIESNASWATLGMIDWSGFSALWTWRGESYDKLYEPFHFARNGQGERMRSTWGLTIGFSGPLQVH